MAKQPVSNDAQTDTMVEAVFGAEAAVHYVPDMSGMQQLGGQIERTAMSQANRHVPEHIPSVSSERREKVNQMLVDAESEVKQMTIDNDLSLI